MLFIHTGNSCNYCFKIQIVMKKLRPLYFLLVTLGVMGASPAFSQVQCNLLQANNASAATHAYSTGYWFGIRSGILFYLQSQ